MFAVERLQFFLLTLHGHLVPLSLVLLLQLLDIGLQHLHCPGSANLPVIQRQDEQTNHNGQTDNGAYPGRPGALVHTQEYEAFMDAVHHPRDRPHKGSENCIHLVSPHAAGRSWLGLPVALFLSSNASSLA